MPLGRDTTITWYGHSCIEIRTPGDKVVIIDPWFQNPTSPKPPTDVDRCDVLIVTHGHFDHFGDCLMVGSRTRPIWPAMHELSLWLGRNFAHKDGVIGMNQGGTVDAAGIGVTMVPAIHSSGDIYAGAEAPIYFGTAVGVVLELENGYRIYHAGDTVAFSDMQLIRELWKPDLAMLPIGGHFTMGPTEAALAVGFLGVKDVIPLHFGTFPILTGTPQALRDALATRGMSGVTVHEPTRGVPYV
jgi:L-ascorbate metabolism protein UlaG (beta-lactamase superfamily)